MRPISGWRWLARSAGRKSCEQGGEAGGVGKVGEVVPDRPYDDLGLRQPLVQPGRVGRVKGGRSGA